jgi:hypothetical protein
LGFFVDGYMDMLIILIWSISNSASPASHCKAHNPVPGLWQPCLRVPDTYCVKWRSISLWYIHTCAQHHFQWYHWDIYSTNISQS